MWRGLQGSDERFATQKEETTQKPARKWAQETKPKTKNWKENQRLRWTRQNRSSEAKIQIDSCQELSHLFNQLSSSPWAEISSSRTLHQPPLNPTECSMRLTLTWNLIFELFLLKILCCKATISSGWWSTVIQKSMKTWQIVASIHKMSHGSNYCPELALKLHTQHPVTKIRRNFCFCFNRGRKSARCLYKITLCYKFLVQF